MTRKASEEYLATALEIMKTGHWLTDQVNAALKPLSISEPQFNVLKAIESGNGSPISQQDIQAQMVQKSSNVSRIIDKLIAKGYVSRTICKENRRKMDILLTKNGIDFLKRANKAVLGFHSTVSDNLKKAELKSLRNKLAKLSS